MQIEGTKLIFIINISVLGFLQICLQNASDCTDFSLDFQNFPGGGGGACPQTPPRNVLFFFFLEQFQALKHGVPSA